MLSVILVLLHVIMFAMTMEEVHERACKNKDERRVRQNMLPMKNQRDDHRHCEEIVEPVRNAEVFHRFEGLLNF